MTKWSKRERRVLTNQTTHFLTNSMKASIPDLSFTTIRVTTMTFFTLNKVMERFWLTVTNLERNLSLSPASISPPYIRKSVPKL